MKDFSIEMIEALKINEVKEMAIETMEIKEHQCFFVDFDGYFGYSVLVFKNGKHIYHVDDFELHHVHIVKKLGKKALKQWYIKSLNKKLFTDVELLEEIKNYDEYKRKNHFLRNYYIMRYDYVSCFGEHKAIKKAKKDSVFNPVSFCYVKDGDIVKEQMKILKHLETFFEKTKSNNEIFREMVSSELANHEACITCDYTDALKALGLEFEKLTKEKQDIVKEELSKQIQAYTYY